MSSGPKYMSIHDNLKLDILSGKYPAGTFLPTESMLMETYSASRTTIRSAVALLVDEGFVSVRQGRGTEVLPLEKFSKPGGFRKFQNAVHIAGRFLTDGPKQLSVQGAVIERAIADQEIADALGLKRGDSVFRLNRIQYIDNQPFSYMIDYVRPDRFPDLEQQSAKIFDLQKFWEEVANISPFSSEETISAVNAGFVESQVLNVSVGDPLLLFRKRYECDAGPLQYSVTTHRCDIFNLVVTGRFGGTPDFHSAAAELPGSGN